MWLPNFSCTYTCPPGLSQADMYILGKLVCPVGPNFVEPKWRRQNKIIKLKILLDMSGHSKKNIAGRGAKQRKDTKRHTI